MTENKKNFTKEDFLSGKEFIKKYKLEMTTAELSKRIQTLKGVSIPGNPRTPYVIWNRVSHNKENCYLIHPLAEEALLAKLTSKGK